jgi:hypothetical protein
MTGPNGWPAAPSPPEGRGLLDGKVVVITAANGNRPLAVVCDVTVEDQVQHLYRQGQGGVVVNNASVLGWRAQAGQAHYAAAKAGVMALTHCSAVEAAPHGVRVNAVAPSLALHPFLSKVMPEEELAEPAADTRSPRRLPRHPIQRLGDDERHRGRHELSEHGPKMRIAERRNIDVPILRRVAFGQVHGDLVALVAEPVGQLPNVPPTVQNRAPGVDRRIVGRQVQLGRVDSHPPRVNESHLVHHEGASGVEGPEVLEGAGRPREVERCQ